MSDIKRVKLEKENQTKEVKEKFVKILLSEGWKEQKDSKKAEK